MEKSHSCLSLFSQTRHNFEDKYCLIELLFNLVLLLVSIELSLDLVLLLVSNGPFFTLTKPLSISLETIICLISHKYVESIKFFSSIHCKSTNTFHLIMQIFLCFIDHFINLLLFSIPTLHYSANFFFNIALPSSVSSSWDSIILKFFLFSVFIFLLLNPLQFWSHFIYYFTQIIFSIILRGRHTITESISNFKKTNFRKEDSHPSIFFFIKDLKNL